MGCVPPPLSPSNAEIDRRIAAGARTVRKIDPEFAAWLDRQQRFRAVGWTVIAASLAVVLASVGAVALVGLQ